MTNRPSTASSRRSTAARRRLAAGISLVGVLAVGVAGLVLGVVVQVTPEHREVVPLEIGAAYTAPQRVPFTGDLVVYGTPPQGKRPDLADLGCYVTDGGGPLSTQRAHREDRLVVNDRGLVPLVSFPGVAGHSIACTGQAAADAAPLYVVPGANSRNLIPLAGYSVAVLCVPLALLGLTNLRLTRD